MIIEALILSIAIVLGATIIEHGLLAVARRIGGRDA